MYVVHDLNIEYTTEKCCHYVHWDGLRGSSHNPARCLNIYFRILLARISLEALKKNGFLRRVLCVCVRVSTRKGFRNFSLGCSLQ
jgi:hypothetical protein